MHYQQYVPPAVLRKYVRYFWSFDGLQHSASTLLIRSFADRFPRLIFQNLEGFESIVDQNGTKLPVCYLSGVDTRFTQATMNGSFSHFGVSFYPHALNIFFGVDANELTNEMPAIEWISRTDVHPRLSQAKSHQSRVDIIARFLYDRLGVAKKQHALINHIVEAEHIHATSDISSMQKTYKISERQLERTFKSTVGVSPKHYQRITRFERALSLLTHATYSQLTAIAYELNYSDQSHFIKDFNAFAGITPYNFIKTRNVGAESSSFLFPLEE